MQSEDMSERMRLIEEKGEGLVNAISNLNDRLSMQTETFQQILKGELKSAL
jgi:hypothetical protein